MDKSKSHEIHEERRRYPRIVINSPINILYKIHQLQATIHDISPDGLQIRAAGEILEKINPDNEQISEVNAPLLDVAFYLKLYDIDTKINALCKMYYSNQLTDEKNENVVCGLKFIKFDDYSSRLLNAYFTEEMTSS